MIAFAARALKQLIAGLLYRTGLLTLWWRAQGRRLRGRPLIVTYHRVLPPSLGTDLSQAGIVVSTATFARQIRLLSRLFHVVPLVRAASAQDPGLCAITFDDGWADNHAHALPVLRSAGLPATLFVVTELLGTNHLFWPERLIYMLSRDERQRLDSGALDGLPAPVMSALLEVAGTGEQVLPSALDRLIEAAKDMTDEERDHMLTLIEQKTGCRAEGLAPRLLDWTQVAEIRAAGVEIGAHGATHAILTRLEPARASTEIRGSRQRLADEFGEPPSCFAYPNGNASPELSRAVRDAGFALAVVTDEAPDPGCLQDFAIRRKNISEGSSRGLFGFSTSIFACEVLGFFDELRRTRRGRTP